MWTNFYNWSTLLPTFLKVKVKTINKYQLFESCSQNAGTIKCQSSALTNSVTYSDKLFKPMTVHWKCGFE